MADYLWERRAVKCVKEIFIKPEIVKKRYNLSLPGITAYTNDSNHILGHIFGIKSIELRHSFLSNISAFRKTYCRYSLFIMAFKPPTLLEAQFYTIWLKVYV